MRRKCTNRLIYEALPACIGILDGDRFLLDVRLLSFFGVLCWLYRFFWKNKDFCSNLLFCFVVLLSCFLSYRFYYRRNNRNLCSKVKTLLLVGISFAVSLFSLFLYLFSDAMNGCEHD